MRDHRKPQAHFIDRLKGKLYGEKLVLAKLESNETSETIKRRARISLHIAMEEIVYNQYSAGKPLEEIKQTMQRLIHHQQAGYLELNYSYFASVNFIAIAYCLDMDPAPWVEYLNQLKGSEPQELYDRLICRIASEMGADIEIPSHLFDEKPYGHLVRAFEAEASQQVDIIKEYLNRHWYRGHSDCGWYGSHKLRTYSGYWSFESAAVVKILGLNPEEFEGVDYFPIDILQNDGPII